MAFDDFDERQSSFMKETRLEFQLCQNASILYRNGLLTRPFDLVTPLAISTGNSYSIQQEKRRRLGWYWGLHEKHRCE